MQTVCSHMSDPNEGGMLGGEMKPWRGNHYSRGPSLRSEHEMVTKDNGSEKDGIAVLKILVLSLLIFLEEVEEKVVRRAKRV